MLIRKSLTIGTRQIRMYHISALALLAAMPQAGAAENISSIQPVMQCQDLMGVSIAGANVVSTGIVAGEPDRCRVEIVNSDSADHPITMWYELPTSDWSGRFLGTGGAAYVGGFPDFEGIPYPGFVVGSTDVGHTTDWPAAFVTAGFATDADGNLDLLGIKNFAHAGIHEMTIVGKELSAKFYGQAVENAYFDGCSSGGRQGLMEAQRYPTDYNGIMSGAPAINLPRFHVADLWPQVAMSEANHIVSQCKLNFATQAAVAACDEADGLIDGLISNYDACEFDAQSLVGQSADCGQFTAADASIVNSFWQGAVRENGGFLWYGVRKGSNLSGLGGSDGDPLFGLPDMIALEWVQRLIVQDPNWDWNDMTAADFVSYYDQSVEAFNDVVGTDNPDLSVFQQNGGKLLVWHGEADQVIPTDGSVNYFDRVNALAAHSGPTSDFFRLFLAPGVGHCAGGNGPMPVDLLDTLVNWVEQDDAPDTLLAQSPSGDGVPGVSRPLCQYPAYAKYDGSGDVTEATSFACVTD